MSKHNRDYERRESLDEVITEVEVAEVEAAEEVIEEVAEEPISVGEEVAEEISLYGKVFLKLAPNMIIVKLENGEGITLEGKEYVDVKIGDLIEIKK